MDYTVHGILQARILEWIAIPFSRGIFPTPGSNPGFPYCRQILYQLSHQESPRMLKWVAYPLSSGSSWPRNLTGVSCIAAGFFTSWATREAPDTHSCTLQIENRPAPETALMSFVFSLFPSSLVQIFLPSLFSFPGFFSHPSSSPPKKFLKNSNHFYFYSFAVIYCTSPPRTHLQCPNLQRIH